MRKALTMRDVMKLSKAERLRRGKLIGAKPKRKVKEPEPPPHPRLKRWAKPEKPIEIIG